MDLTSSTVTLLTATGARPEAFRLCQTLMLRQTFDRPVKWIIVDDGAEPQAISFSRPDWSIQIVRPEPFWQSGENTQARNLLAGLEHVGANAKLIIIEDDDYYAPDWIAFAANALNESELIGEMVARYYNVSQHRYQVFDENAHASLCCTAMCGSAIQRFKQVCQHNATRIDMTLWREHPIKRLYDSARVVGIKGLPGRAGIGDGHRSEYGTSDQQPFQMLRKWIGEGASLYQMEPPAGVKPASVL